MLHFPPTRQKQVLSQVNSLKISTKVILLYSFNSIKVLVFLRKNSKKKHLWRHGKNYFCVNIFTLAVVFRRQILRN